MKNMVYSKLIEFKKKYPGTIGWRLKSHAKVIEDHLNPDEEIGFAFAAQKNDNPLDIMNTYAIVFTNKRIMLGHKRLLFGYMFVSITPDMFNDLTVNMGIIWGKIYIDTIKEIVKISNIQKEALPEIETYATEYMIREKQKYGSEYHKSMNNN